MAPTLMLAALLAFQNPQAAPKTVEDRLKELDEKIQLLEKKQKTLASENATLEKQVVERKNAFEVMARGTAKAWVQRHSKAAAFSEKQAADLEELWYGWGLDSPQDPGAPAKWKAREDVLRSKLTAEQVPLVARKTREDQEQGAKMWLRMVSWNARLAPGPAAAFEKAASSKLSFPDGILIPAAHPGQGNGWQQALAAVDASMSDLSTQLGDEDLKSLRAALEQLKPRPR